VSKRRRPPRVPPTRKVEALCLGTQDGILILTRQPCANATPVERLALEVRNRATRTGRCACGSVAQFDGVDEDGFGHLVWKHEGDCPAVSLAAYRAMGL
jgi:hypothetical protein